MKILINRIDRAFRLTRDLIANISEFELKLNIKEFPSNTIGEQLWCMIGARESYLLAIKNDVWSGFNCSLKNTNSKEDILNCLDNSKEAFLSFVSNNDLSENQKDFLFDILEHEIQHHGQLIRYFYANKIKFPESWNKRYTV